MATTVRHVPHRLQPTLGRALMGGLLALAGLIAVVSIVVGGLLLLLARSASLASF
ncbi:MAG TPA: hypothetical protein VFY86_03140 [Nocardioides sp.]|jgi:hypothetical protein|nr:hypothetical protein [uncultured Nocardioides sp.]HEX5985487.1 hypothetical protein [Nocardioides sp.]